MTTLETPPTDALPDADARRRIRTDTAATLFVDAGAGAGKTSALVDRVCTLVERDGVPLPQIAAITFTEKAGAELRDRLRAEFEQRLRDGGGADGDDRAALLRRALDDLDAAAFGTLHSFAQRILLMFPIQAGLPPLIEVLDEVGSSIAFDDRWSSMRQQLLDDDALADPLLLALSTNPNTLDHLRSLARAFGSDWDLIDERVLAAPPPPARLPDTDELVRWARELVERGELCSDSEDLFLAKLSALWEWADGLSATTNDQERFAALGAAEWLKWGYGRAANWSKVGLKALKEECQELQERARQVAAAFAEAALRPLAYWIAGRVRAEADARLADGRLEFHDLLVAARDLLRRDPEVRAQLQAEFPRLLLDEFQDTDPIQIELALRIAAGEAGDAVGWEELAAVVPPGALFLVGDPKQSIYRFRRASIETYLDARAALGEQVALTTNFRSTAPILSWVNTVFGQLIQADENAQPAYQALAPYRADAASGPSVVVLGQTPHDDKPDAATLREREADDVAGAIVTALAEGWQVQDSRNGTLRPARLGDIAVLIPARTSLPFLEDALQRAGVPYRAESSSLAYQGDDIRELMAALRTLADPTDQLSCVTALRSSLFGCGDDDLFTYRRDGGRFSILLDVPEALAQHPVGRAMAYLRGLHFRSRWMAPSEVLTELVVDRRVLEVAATGQRARDQWRRIRFVIDQARAWSEVQHGGLREYVGWAMRQADETSRVAEAILPETDLDVVKIMTIHAAKGLEFGMVVLSGMTAQPQQRGGVKLLWTPDSYAVRLTKRLQTNDFEAVAPVDEQMDEYERLRLLYVGATRARDHLVVSLHRGTGNTQTAAKRFADAGAGEVPGVVAFTAMGEERLAAGVSSSAADAVPAPEWDEWLRRVTAARERSRKASVYSPSGLEGTEPEVALVLPTLSEEEAEIAAGQAKGARDVELPPWSKGRYGNLVGRAVHGTLQSIDLATGEGLEAIVAAQCLVEGVTQHADAVAGFVRSALASPMVSAAASADRHWREMFVGMQDPNDPDVVMQGYIDLVFRDADGVLTIVDYKTDTVPDAALPSRTRYYAPQIREYQRALEAATGERARGVLLFLDHRGGAARAVEVPRAASDWK